MNNKEQLKNIVIVNIQDNIQKKFLKSKMIIFKKENDDKENIWETIDSHDSVHILVDNIETKEILIVKQIRVPVLKNDNSQNGICYEACAGIVDKNKSILEIAKEEILEELGYDVQINNIKHIKTLKSSVGSAGVNCYTFEVQTTEKERISNGGGTESEDIIVVRIPYQNIRNFIYSNIHTDSTTMFLITNWLLRNKEY